jgi:hypothetical protein
VAAGCRGYRSAFLERLEVCAEVGRYMLDNFGRYSEDSVTVFISVGAEGRGFWLQGGGGLEGVHLGQGDVSVMSARAFHCGGVQAAANPVLFFHLDRHSAFQMAVSEGNVGDRWVDVRDRASYCVRLSIVCGLRGLVRGVREGWGIVEGGEKRGRTAPVRLTV